MNVERNNANYSNPAISTLASDQQVVQATMATDLIMLLISLWIYGKTFILILVFPLPQFLFLAKLMSE